MLWMWLLLPLYITGDESNKKNLTSVSMPQLMFCCCDDDKGDYDCNDIVLKVK